MLGLGGMLYYAHQAQRINEAEDKAKHGAKEVAALDSQLRAMSERFEKLVLITTALWSLIKERTDLTEEQLMERIREIDLQDGQADGKISKPKNIYRCPKCDRTMSTRHGRCLYCGCQNLNAEPFDGVF